MIENGSPILVKNTAGTLTFRNQADDTDLKYVTPATQTDQSASRADGTVYQNTTGRALFCSVSFNDDVGRLATAYSDASNPPTTIVAKATSSGVNFMQLFFIVLPGNYYKVVFSNPPTTLIWVEWS